MLKRCTVMASFGVAMLSVVDGLATEYSPNNLAPESYVEMEAVSAAEVKGKKMQERAKHLSFGVVDYHDVV